MSLGVDVLGFGPIGRELATRLVSDVQLSTQFRVESISDSSGTIHPESHSEVLKAVGWKNSGRKLSELSKAQTDQISKSSIVVDVTNSDYNKSEEAKKRALYSLEARKHFVSANKVALAYHFTEIMQEAKKRKLEVGFGATICGGRHAISVANNIESHEIQSASAVLNASTTMILSMLEEDHSLTFDEACKKAAETGVLESDWGIDLDGIDAAAKTAILANVLFPNSGISMKDVVRRGIRDEKCQALIQTQKIKGAGGEKIRLVSEITQDGVTVEPMVVPRESPLGVSGRFNVVLLRTNTLGEISVRNLGGGVALTSAVIISDLKKIAERSQRVSQ